MKPTEQESYYVQMIMEDIIEAARSIFTVVISLLLATLILNTKIPLDISSPINLLSSSVILLGFICLVSSLFGIPLWILTSKFLSIDLADIIARLILVIISLLSTFSLLEASLGVLGVLGIILGLSLYVITGRWYLFPHDAISGYRRESYLRARAAASAEPNKVGGTATGASSG